VDILHISLPALILQTVAFLLLIWIMRKYLFGPINGVLEARQSEVENTVEQLRRERQSMETSRRDYETRLAGIEAEARDTIQAAIKEAQGMKDEIISSARADAEQIVTRARDEVVREKQQAMVELRNTVADLAVSAAGKILRRSVDDRAQRELVSDFISQMGA